MKKKIFFENCTSNGVNSSVMQISHIIYASFQTILSFKYNTKNNNLGKTVLEMENGLALTLIWQNEP